MKAIVTVLGTDKVGIIAAVSRLLAERNANILDISQTILQEYFTMIMLVDISRATMKFDEISAGLDAMAREMNLSIRLQHEDLFNAMNRI